MCVVQQGVAFWKSGVDYSYGIDVLHHMEHN